MINVLNNRLCLIMHCFVFCILFYLCMSYALRAPLKTRWDYPPNKNIICYILYVTEVWLKKWKMNILFMNQQKLVVWACLTVVIMNMFHMMGNENITPFLWLEVWPCWWLVGSGIRNTGLKILQALCFYYVPLMLVVVMMSHTKHHMPQ